MKSAKPKLLGVAVVAAAVLGVWWLRGGGGDSHSALRGADPRLILERPWIDRIPDKPTDFMNAFVMVSRQSVGVFHKASRYRVTAELFRHQRGGSTEKPSVAFSFPQTGKKAEARYRIWECDDLDGFDLCLELSRNPWEGPRRYHSARDWESHQRLGTLSSELQQNLPTM